MHPKFLGGRKALLVNSAITPTVIPFTVVGKGDFNCSGTPSHVTIPSDAGLQLNDILVVKITCNSGSALTVISQNGSGSAFTTLHSGDTWTVDFRVDHIYSIVLSSADITDGTFQVTGTGSNDGISMVVLRGANSVSYRQFAVGSTDADPNLTFTGYTPGVGSKGALVMALDRDDSTSPTASGFTSVWNHLNTFLHHYIFTNTTYSGGSITFTPFLTTFQQGGYLLEVF